MLNPFSSWWPSSLPFVLQVLIAIVVTDVGVTAVHVASHRVGWLWRFHAVHHSVKRFYGFNGLMKHPLHGALELAAGILPLLILGLPKAIAEFSRWLLPFNCCCSTPMPTTASDRYVKYSRSTKVTASTISSGLGLVTSTSDFSPWDWITPSGHSPSTPNAGLASIHR